MMKNVTRSRLIQVWLAIVALGAVAALALGVTMTFATGVLLLALGLALPVMIMMLWPGVEAQTASEVIHGTERRP